MERKEVNSSIKKMFQRGMLPLSLHHCVALTKFKLDRYKIIMHFKINVKMHITYLMHLEYFTCN